MFWRWAVPQTGVDAERRLVAAARRNDRSAFDSLMHAHQERLRAFLIRRVGPNAAEDVFQETCLAAWQGMPRLDLRVRFKTWLFSIAVHKAADYHRTLGRLTRQEVALDAAQLPAPSDALDAVEHKVLARRVLDSLNEDQRQILEMYYFAELTLPEMATILGRNLNTLKYQFYRIHAITAETFAMQQEESTLTAPNQRSDAANTRERRLSPKKGLSVVQ
jgi:RNA polymerase sigma-70 factor (ECF subfamily)